MKTRTHKEQMPARSGRRRGGSEERRGRRPHPSPSRAERNDRQTRIVEELGCFTRRPQGHDSSESDAERTILPPKRPKVQDSSSSASTSAHSTCTTTSVSHPATGNILSRESDNEDRQSQASRSSTGRSLVNSSSSVSSGRDIDQDNRSSSPSLSGSPLASLDSESDMPESPKLGGKVKDGLMAKTGVAARVDDASGAECRDTEGVMEANLSPLKSPLSLGPLTDGPSAKKSFFSNDSKMLSKMEFSGAACDEALHRCINVNTKMAPQCGGKPLVGGAVEYAHANPGVNHSPSSALPPPPALKPLEAGQGDVKIEKVEKCDKLPASHLLQSASVPQQAPPPRHSHHYSPNTWSGNPASTHGNWGYSRYPGIHHAPVQQQQLPSVYNPPSSTRHPNHPPYLPHTHANHTLPPNTHRDYMPRFSSPTERERPVRDFGIKDTSANASATGPATSANPGSDFGTPVTGQPREFAAPSRDGTSVGREFRSVFRERDAARDLSLQNLNQQHVAAQSRDFGSGGASGSGGATGCHSRDKEERWGDFSGQIRNAGGNNNQSVTSTTSTSLPVGSPQNSSATSNKDFQSSVEQVGQGPPSQVPTGVSDPPSTGHFLRDYPPHVVKEYPPTSGPPSGPHPGSSRDYPSPTGHPPNVGRDFAGGPAVPPTHYMVQSGLNVQSKERERERERDKEREQERENIALSSLYSNRSHPPSLSPSTSSSGHGHPPVPSYPPTSHSQQPPPPSIIPANQTRPTQYPLSNQSPSTPLSPLPSPSKNQMGGFPPFSSPSAPPTSGVVTSCISGNRSAPYHGNLNSHAPYPNPNPGYHNNSTHSNNASTSNTNSNSGATSNVQLHSPPPSKIQPHLCSPVASQPIVPTGAEGQGDPMPCPVLPPPVIKEEPIEEREEADSPSTVLRSPSPEPKPIDIPIHASQSARFHRVLDRGNSNSCARTDVLFIPLDGSKLWKKRNEVIERARREVEQRARDLREKERERERERDRERERERDLERHLQQKESNPATVPRQGSSLFFPPSSSILLDPSSSSTSCMNPSHQAAHHPAHSLHHSHAHSIHPSLAHSIPHQLLLPSVGGLGPYLGPDTPALRTLSEYARPHTMSPLGAPNRAPPHFHHHPHHHPHAHPHMHPSLFLPQFQNPALAHPHHLPTDAATAAAILGFLYGSGLEGGHGHHGVGPVAGPGPGGMAGLGAGLGGVGFPHAVAAHRERVKTGYDFKSEFDSHTHSHSHSLLLGGGTGGGAPPSDVAIYGTPPPPAPPPPALVSAARNQNAVPPPLSTPPTSSLLPPSLPSHAPPMVNPTAPAPPPPPPAPPPPPPPPPTATALHQPSTHSSQPSQPPAPEGYSTPIRTPPSTERARSVERERERERERVLPSAERERAGPAVGGAGGGAGGSVTASGASGGGSGAGESLGRLQMLNVTPHHHQHSHIHSHLHLHQQDTAASTVHPLIDPLTTGAPLPRLPYPGSIITHPLTESDVLRQQLFGGPFRDLPPHSSMHHQNTELQIQRLALEQQWIHHHTHSLTQEDYYSHLKKESDKTL